MKTYKGHKYDNIVIEVLTPEHGKNVVKQFWQSNGVDVSAFTFNVCKSDKNDARFYGLKDGIFGNYTNPFQGVQILTLPVEPETQAFPFYITNEKIKDWLHECIDPKVINETFKSISAKYEQLEQRKNELEEELTNIKQQIKFYSQIEQIFTNK